MIMSLRSEDKSAPACRQQCVSCSAASPCRVMEQYFVLRVIADIFDCDEGGS